MDERPTDDSEPRASDVLLEVLASVLDQIDGPSDAAVERAAALFTLRSLDAELLVLLTDTNTEKGSELVARAEQLEWRLVVFQGATCTIQLDVLPGERRLDLIGQITPPGVHSVEIHHDGVVDRFRTDSGGRFQTPSPRRPFRVLVAFADGTRVLTPTVET